MFYIVHPLQRRTTQLNYRVVHCVTYTYLFLLIPHTLQMLQYNKTQSNTHNTIRYHTIWKCYILYHLVYQFSHMIEQLLVQGRCLLTVPPPWPEMSLSIQQKCCSYLTRAPVLSCYLTCTRPPCLAMTLVPQVITHHPTRLSASCVAHLRYHYI